MSSGIEKALERARLEEGGQRSAPGKSIARITGKRSKDISRRLEAQKSLAKMRESYLLPYEKLTERRIISGKTSDTPVGNSLKELRAKIIKEYGDEGLVISILAVDAQGGGSFVALNLAAAIAFDESKSALVIDCNMNSQSADYANKDYLEGEVAVGLSDYLENDDIEESDIILPTGIKRVRFVPAGSESVNFAERFSSIRFQQFIDTASSRYDNRYVILDAPPILESADASILVELSDAVIIVLPYGEVSKRQLEDALAIIGRDRITGIVINNEPELSSYLK